MPQGHHNFMPHLGPHRHEAAADQQSQSHRKENLPSYFHELVEAITRERATIPDIEVHEPGNFCREPENVADAVADWRNEHGQTDQGEHDSESSQAYRLHAEERMLGHSHRVEEADGGEEKKG